MEPQTSTALIIPLESIHPEDEVLTGKKASGISRLIRLGFTVPEGFCVSTTAYTEHLEQCGALIPAGVAENEERASIFSGIRAAIIKKPLSDRLTASLKEQYDRLNTPFAAVRSSATEEDLAGQSYAGLYETYLGIRSFNECIDALKKCWASLWNERVFLYRKNQGIDHQSASMAVIVQRLINADSSGVVFTSGFPGGNDDRIVIEACRGLGESLVSGKVTPDRFIIRKRDLHVLEKSIASKSLLVDLDRDGLLRERSLSSQESRRASLDNTTIKKLCNLVLKAESAAGQGQDIEWAVRDGTIYLLQCRPITAMLRLDSGEPPHIWSNANTGEVLPDVVTPLSYSFISTFIDSLFNGTLRRMGIDFGPQRIIEQINGRVYFDITALAEIMHHLPGFMKADLNTFFGGHQEKLLGNLLKRFPRGFSHPKINIFRLLANLPLFILKVIMSSERDKDKLIAELKDITKVMKSRDISSLSESELMDIINVFKDKMLKKIPDDMAIISGGFPGYQNLSTLCRSWFEDRHNSCVNRLLMSTGKVDSADPALALMEIACLTRFSPELEELIKTEQCFIHFREKALKASRGEEFLRLMDQFMDCHGHHTIGELELYNPRWAENPDYVLSIVKGYAENLKSTDPLAEYRKRAEERKALIHECQNRNKNPLKRMIFNLILSRATCGLALREMYKSEIMRQFSVYRAVFLELGRRFVSGHITEQRDDIFFLCSDEIEAISSRTHTINVKETVESRKREYEKNLTIAPHPIVIGTRDEKKFIPYAADDTLDLLAGISVCSGTAKGPARVFASKDECAHILPGEILVIPCSDPGWSPYFIASAGIVMDMGGMLSHGCIIAREYGIPTVVNVGPATKIIRTGQLIEVDGNTGTVRIIRHAQEHD
ncbi:MAG: PEP/pyruvate-binding domain-containing protein [Candidatus Xenobiia bacterium LiM19]